MCTQGAHERAEKKKEGAEKGPKVVQARRSSYCRVGDRGPGMREREGQQRGRVHEREREMHGTQRGRWRRGNRRVRRKVEEGK